MYTIYKCQNLWEKTKNRVFLSIIKKLMNNCIVFWKQSLQKKKRKSLADTGAWYHCSSLNMSFAFLHKLSTFVTVYKELGTHFFLQLQVILLYNRLPVLWCFPPPPLTLSQAFFPRRIFGYKGNKGLFSKCHRFFPIVSTSSG